MICSIFIFFIVNINEYIIFIITFIIATSFYFISLIPFPFYCGVSVAKVQSNTCIGLDNGNIGFLLLIGILFPLIY